MGFATWGLRLFWRAEGRALLVSLDRRPSLPASPDTGVESGGLESKYTDEVISS